MEEGGVLGVMRRCAYKMAFGRVHFQEATQLWGHVYMAKADQVTVY